MLLTSGNVSTTDVDESGCTTRGYDVLEGMPLPNQDCVSQVTPLDSHGFVISLSGCGNRESVLVLPLS